MAVANEKDLSIFGDEKTASHDGEDNGGLAHLVHEDPGEPDGRGWPIGLGIVRVRWVFDGRCRAGWGRGWSRGLVLIGGQSVHVAHRVWAKEDLAVDVGCQHAHAHKNIRVHFVE